MMQPPKVTERILCVNDDDDTCELLHAFFTVAGYEVQTARTVAEGLRLASQGRGDVIVLDNWHPEGGGSELCREMRAVAPHTPVLFYSAVAGDAFVTEGLKAGTQAYLIKPADIDWLVPTVSRENPSTTDPARWANTPDPDRRARTGTPLTATGLGEGSGSLPSGFPP